MDWHRQTSKEEAYRQFARGCLLPVIAFLMFGSSCVWSDILTDGKMSRVNPMSAMSMKSHRIINGTDQTLRLTPIAGSGETHFFIPPLTETNCPESALDRWPLRETIDAPIVPGAALEFVFDWDDMTLRHFVVKTERGDLYQYEVVFDKAPPTEISITSLASLRTISPATREAYQEGATGRILRVLFVLFGPPVALGLYVWYEFRIHRRRIGETSSVDAPI